MLADKIQPQPLKWNSEDVTLISPLIDFLMIGGASIVLLALMAITLKSETPSENIAWLVFYFSFAVNFPHFLVSYQILYYDFRKEIFKNIRFFWAAVIVPVLLLGGILTCLFTASPKALGLFANAMYFFVGWHYVKQIFGGIMVTNTLKKYFYSNLERRILKINLFSLWWISYIGQNIGRQNYNLNGIAYYSFNFPTVWLQPIYWLTTLSAFAVIVVHIRKYIETGSVPSKLAVVCFLSIYAWYLPALFHPMFFHLIPFFHSLQYLLFVYAFRRNKTESEITDPNTPEGRKKWLDGIYGYLAVSVMTGAIAFWFLPHFIDAKQLVNTTLFGSTVAMFAFTVFINIHHYFIDNVLWRGSNPEMKKYLFQAHSH